MYNNPSHFVATFAQRSPSALTKVDQVLRCTGQCCFIAGWDQNSSAVSQNAPVAQVAEARTFGGGRP